MKRPDLITEKDVEKDVRTALKKACVWHWKHWGGGFSGSNIADVLGVLPVKVQDLVDAGVEEVGVFLAIELKRPGKRPTKDQEDWGKDVRAARGIWMWADNVEKVVRELGLAKRAHPLLQIKNDVIGKLFRKGKGDV